MALRLVYKISSTIVKPALFGNTSPCLRRRFRSLSPALNRTKEESPDSVTPEEDAYECTRRRSRSYPNESLRDGSPCFQTSTCSYSNTRDGNDDDENEINYDDDEVDNNLRNTRSSSRMESKRQKQLTAQKSKSNSAIVFNRNAGRFNQYHLKHSMPEEKKDNFSNVYDYYTKQHKQEALKVIPHLQPHNLKPYGTGGNLIFPTGSKKITKIKYPVTEYGYNRKNVKKTEPEDEIKIDFSTSRNFSTTSKNIEQILDEYKRLNPKFIASKTNLVPGSLEETNFVQRTMHLVSDYRQKYKTPSDLEKCNQVISEYKKINPYYQPHKKEIKSGSEEEKEAVNQAVNFAANYKKFCQGTATPQTIQTLMYHTNNIQSNYAEKKEECENTVKRAYSLPVLEKKDVYNLPPEPMRLRVGPRANLLQSNASPEAASQWDNLQLGENEKLTTPWPSYADHLKLQFQLNPQKKTKEIVYPIVSNKKNTEIQAVTSTSLIKLDKISDAEESRQKIYPIETQEVTKIGHRQISLPNLNFVRGFCSKTKGNFCEKTVPRKRSKSKDVCILDTPPTPTEGFRSADCKCVKPRPPIDTPPLKRPPKRYIPKGKPNICPVIKPCTTPRADENLIIKPKKLPELVPADDCPCIQFTLQAGCPLRRLPKACVKEPPKICPPCTTIKCNCPPRADKNLKVKKKSLPMIPIGNCPCVDMRKFEDVPPLKKLKKVEMEEPSNFCPPPPSICPPERADSQMVVTPKQLPPLEFSDCKCIDKKPPINVPLPRLKRTEVCEPKKECEPIFDPCDPAESDRADEICQYKVKVKKLRPMILKAENNHISVRGPLPKPKERTCPKVNTSNKRKYCTFAPREDANWKTKKECSSAEPKLRKRSWPELAIKEPDRDAEEGPKLKRLVKLHENKDTPENDSIVKSTEINERADELFCYEYEHKSLPPLLSSQWKKDFHSLERRDSDPLLGNALENLSATQLMISTTPNLLKKDCSIAEKTKSCPKQKPLPGCQKPRKKVCEPEYEFKECSKQKPPYPSFSECGSVSKFPKCEGRYNPSLKFLQPKYPIIPTVKLIKVPALEDKASGFKKEADCILEKLGKKREGVTQTCDTFGCPVVVQRAKDVLGKEENECPSVGTKKSNKRSKKCKNRSKKKKTSYPVCKYEPPKSKKTKIKNLPKFKEKDVVFKCAAPRKSKKNKCKKPKPKTKKICKAPEPSCAKPQCKPDPSVKKPQCKPDPSVKKPQCKPDSSVKKPQSKPDPSIKKSVKKSVKMVSSSKSVSSKKTASKSSIKISTLPAVIQTEQPKSLFSRILSFFSSTPSSTSSSSRKTSRTATLETKKYMGNQGAINSTAATCKKKSTNCGHDKCSKSNAKKTAKCNAKKQKSKKKCAKKGKGGKDKKKSKVCQPKKKPNPCCNQKEPKEDNSKFANMFPPDMPVCVPRGERTQACETTPPCPLKCIPMDAARISVENFNKGVPEPECCSSKCKPKKSCVDKAPVYKTKKKKKPPKASCRKIADDCTPKKEESSCEKEAPCCETKKKKFSPPKASCRKIASECKPKKKKKCCKKLSLKRKPKKKKDSCKKKPPACKPKKDDSSKKKALKCKPKKKDSKCKKKGSSCTPKKTSPCKPEKPPCKPKKKTPDCGPESSDKCIKIQIDYPPKYPEDCPREYVFTTFKAPQAPYSSFSERHEAANAAKRIIADIRAKASAEVLQPILHRHITMNNNKCNKKNYSTFSIVSRARAFHRPSQWNRHYSSRQKGHNNTLDNAKKTPEEKNHKSLNQRLLTSIDEGIAKLESQDADLPNNLYYQVLKALQKLSEKEINEFFDQEAQFNPLFKSDVSETVSFVCKLNPKAEQILFLNNDINFEPRCVGISDPNILSEDAKTIAAFKNLCKKLCDEAEYQDLPYEELERRKTEDMRRELDLLLIMAQNNQK